MAKPVIHLIEAGTTCRCDPLPAHRHVALRIDTRRNGRRCSSDYGSAGVPYELGDVPLNWRAPALRRDGAWHRDRIGHDQATATL